MRPIVSLLVVLGISLSLGAQDQKPVGVVSHVKVLSDRVQDVSSLEAWKKSYLRDDMSDREKALAIWRTVVAHQHQDSPPLEFLQNEDDVLDPFKIFNVYGYSFCGVAASEIESLARSVGLEARGHTIVAHVVPEVMWNGRWHLLDASLINYFVKPDGDVAGVEELIASLSAWYEEHPELKKNDPALRQFGMNWGWKHGPALLANSTFYDKDGWLPAATHGWYSTMQEYDGSTHFAYENGYSLGYQVNVQLRKGERLTRNWSNKGLYANMDGTGGAPGCMTGQVGQGAMRYTPFYGDLAPGRVGNGVHEYDVPLADGAFRLGALAAQNLASKSEDGKDPAVHVKDAGKPGVYVVRMPTSYVYLTGAVIFDAVVGAGGSVVVSFSDNNGLDWTEIANVKAAGAQKVDLSKLVLRRYDYRLKFEMKGEGTGLNALRIVHDVQHSQRPLPALALGKNTIAFSSENEGTVTVEAATNLKNKDKQVVYTDFHPQMTGIGDPMISATQPPSEIVFPIETPADMKRLRVSTFYRVRDARDAWDVAVSFDDGKTFKPLGTCEGPRVFFGKYFVVEDVPAATRKALVKWSCDGVRNAVMIFNFRIDADYVEPQSGFAPVKVTYLWTEDGAEKTDVHVAKTPTDTWTIACAKKPVMKSLIVERAD
jgi:hypothetical protein